MKVKHDLLPWGNKAVISNMNVTESDWTSDFYLPQANDAALAVRTAL